MNYIAGIPVPAVCLLYISLCLIAFRIHRKITIHSELSILTIIILALNSLFLLIHAFYKNEPNKK